MRWPSGAITAHCSGAHQRMHMAMSLCSGPQHGAADARRAPHDTRQKKSAADAATTSPPSVSSQRAERPSTFPTVLAVVVRKTTQKRSMRPTAPHGLARCMWRAVHVAQDACRACCCRRRYLRQTQTTAPVVLEHSSRSGAHEPRCRPRRRQLPFSFLRSLADARINAGTNVTSPQARGHGSGRDCGSTSPCRLSGASPEVRRRPASKRTSATASARNRPKTLRPTRGVFGGERSATVARECHVLFSGRDTAHGTSNGANRAIFFLARLI